MKLYKAICSDDIYLPEHSICHIRISFKGNWEFEFASYPKSHKYKVDIENFTGTNYDIFSSKTKKECEEFIKKMGEP